MLYRSPVHADSHSGILAALFYYELVVGGVMAWKRGAIFTHPEWQLVFKFSN
jgi:hypothetical protein